VVTLLRTLFEVRFVSVQPQTRMLQVRAPKPVLDDVTRFLDGLAAGRPQVDLHVEVLEVARTSRHNIGTQLPLQFTVFNIGSEALKLAASPDIQAQINALIQSGGINQASAQAIAALLAQLQASPNSLLGQPIATFGGGTTLFGLVIPPASVQLEVNESRVNLLENASLRAAEGDAATLKVGTRFPILNATFAPILNSPDLSKVIENNSFQAPFPSFQYQDLGVVVKATPHIHSGGSDISLELELDVSALSASSLNGIPLITHRQYIGSITVKEGETAVVAGTVTRSEQRTLGGLPVLGLIPVLGKLTAQENTDHTVDELVVVITPRLARRAEQNLAGVEFWMPAAK
jgi:type II secretory pathway component GspD/PulD (secretin)